MTATNLCPLLWQRFVDSNGAPLVKGQLFTYAAGTTNPIATYTDSTGGTSNANPVILDARGECSVWLLPNVGYKFILQDSFGNPIKTVDNVYNSQLLNLYGGVDSGVASAYILTFPSPVAATSDGQLVLWIPSNNNTGPSSINVNGAGAVPLVNPNGSALGANQIIAGQPALIMSLSGRWILLGGAGSSTGVNIGTFGPEAPIASATTTDLGSVPAHNAFVTGTTTITSFGTSAQLVAPVYLVRFGGTLTLTASASLVLPNNVNITTTAGDAALVEYMGAGVWRVLNYAFNTITVKTNAIKLSDTPRQSTIALTADPDLQLTLPVGDYALELFLSFDSVAGSAGFKYELVPGLTDSRAAIPCVASGGVNGSAYGPKVEDPSAAPVSLATVSTTTAGNGVLYKGSLLVTVAGNLVLEWAQASSTGSNTTLRAGSYMTCTPLPPVGTPGTQHTYTTAGTYTETVPAGKTTVIVEVWGASGGGGAFVALSGGGGGGSGGYSRKTLTVAPGNTLSVVIGALGAAGAGGSAGSAGGTSTVTFSAVTLTANGGNGGSPTTPGTGGTGGTASGGDINLTGNTGQSGGVVGTMPPVPVGGNGGAGISGLYDGGQAGGNGGGQVLAATAGNPGVASFFYP